MTTGVALQLAQDGIVAGAIYALLSLATVLVFTVTRVVFIPLGSFVTYGGLTLAAIQSGDRPGPVWLLAGLGLAVTATEAFARRRRGFAGMPRVVLWNIGLPAALLVATFAFDMSRLPFAIQVALAGLIVVPLGPMLYRLAYQPIAAASVLVLLILSIAVDIVLVGLALIFFGAEGARTDPMIDVDIAAGPLTITGQSIATLAASAALIVGLYLLSERTLAGKALRATAVNRTGARLMGISTAASGRLAFTLGAFIAVVAGILSAPTTTIYYDTGFLVGLRGLVGAIVGGLASYPLAAAGAIAVGLIETFAAFELSAFKDAIVFSLVIPILLARTVLAGDRHRGEE